MSVYLNGTGDTVRIIDSGTTLTIGTGALSMGMWVYVPSSPGANRDVMWLTPAASISGVSYVGCVYRSATNSFQAFWETASETSSDTYSISTSTWYWVVVSRDGSNGISCKVFADSTSTTPLQNSTATASFNWTTLDTFLIGQTASTDPSCVMQVQNFKVHTGVQWSNAECRTESQNYGIQTAGGTNRLCWKFTDIDADTDGINEIGGAGPNFTNSGAIADAAAPTQLTSSTLEQEGFRWYEDNGSESGSSAAANQDTNITAAAGATKRLRMLVNATGDPATKQFKLQWKKSGGTWADVL